MINIKDIIVITGTAVPVIAVFYYIRRKKKLMRDRLKTDGEIIDIEKRMGAIMIIAFTTFAGEKLRLKYNEGF